jgi:hypothetical protein
MEGRMTLSRKYLIFFTGLLMGCSHQSLIVERSKLLSPYELSTYKPGPGSANYVFSSCPDTPKAIRDFDLQDISPDLTFAEKPPELPLEGWDFVKESSAHIC